MLQANHSVLMFEQKYATGSQSLMSQFCQRQNHVVLEGVFDVFNSFKPLMRGRIAEI